MKKHQSQNLDNYLSGSSDLGKKIAKAKVGVAATGYYEKLGSSDEQRYPDAQNLSTNDVLVQGTTFVQDPVKINTKNTPLLGIIFLNFSLCRSIFFLFE